MYDTAHGMKALRTIDEFNIEKHLDALRVFDPLDEVVINVGSSYTENIAVIAKKTVVDGNITSESPISLSGTVNGNITTSSDIGVNGTVVGDISADSINYSRAAVRGNSVAVKDVNVSSNAVIIGDIDASKLTLAGKVKGNVNVSQNVLFKASSLMSGSVCAGSMNMEDGSRINASITIRNTETSQFDEDEFDIGV